MEAKSQRSRISGRRVALGTRVWISAMALRMRGRSREAMYTLACFLTRFVTVALPLCGGC